ncbi:mutator type transposase [Tanacetum coccineum]
MDRPLTSAVTKFLKANSNEANKYTVDWGGDEFYQVSGPWGDQVVVNVLARTCTCRRWELISIPCKYVMATNWNMSLNNQQVGFPEEWVHPCYMLNTLREVYSIKINPIRGSQSKKISSGEAASSANYRKYKGKSTTTTMIKKKRAPMKKVIVLG